MRYIITGNWFCVHCPVSWTGFWLFGVNAITVNLWPR